MLALLHSTDGAGFVEIALVVYVELAEGILEGEDGALVELGILPAAREKRMGSGGTVGGIPYLCNLIIFMVVSCGSL